MIQNERDDLVRRAAPAVARLKILRELTLPSVRMFDLDRGQIIDVDLERRVHVMPQDYGIVVQLNACSEAIEGAEVEYALTRYNCDGTAFSESGGTRVIREATGGMAPARPTLANWSQWIETDACEFAGAFPVALEFGIEYYVPCEIERYPADEWIFVLGIHRSQ